MLIALTLGLITLCTSTLTGIFGLGGGLLLIGIIPLFLPVTAVIPVHGVTQLASNSSRAWFGRGNIAWEVLRPYCLGGVAGAAVFAVLLHFISMDYLPLFIGGYILLSQWSALFNRLIHRCESFQLLGFIQVGLGVLVGAPGPIHIVLLRKHYEDKHTIVTTAAALLTVMHMLKIIAFIVLGIRLWQYGNVMLAMIIGAIIGSFIGTKLRGTVDGQHFTIVLKVMLSLLAIKMVVSVIN